MEKCNTEKIRPESEVCTFYPGSINECCLNIGGTAVLQHTGKALGNSNQTCIDITIKELSVAMIGGDKTFNCKWKLNHDGFLNVTIKEMDKKKIILVSFISHNKNQTNF